MEEEDLKVEVEEVFIYSPISNLLAKMVFQESFLDFFNLYSAHCSDFVSNWGLTIVFCWVAWLI